MSIPEDQLAALEAEVAAVLGILEVFETMESLKASIVTPIS